MAKFAITKRSTETQSTIDPSITKAVKQATPLAHAFAEKIMSYYNPPSIKADLSVEEKEIQDLFYKWPGDDMSNRISQLCELITGFKPEISSKPTDWKIGSLFKQAGNVFAVVYIDPNYVYGINASANNSVYIDFRTNSNEGSPSHVTKAEAGLFAKSLLASPGSKIISYIAKYGEPAVSSFLAKFDDQVVI